MYLIQVLGSVLGFAMWLFYLAVIYKGYLIALLVIRYLFSDSAPPDSHWRQMFTRFSDWARKYENEPGRKSSTTDLRFASPIHLARGTVLHRSEYWYSLYQGKIPATDGRELRLYYPPTHRIQVYYRIGDEWMFSHEYILGSRPNGAKFASHQNGDQGRQLEN